MNKFMLFKIIACLVVGVNSAQAIERQTDEQHIKSENGVMAISDELSNVLAEWNGELEQNVSFLEFLKVERDISEIVSNYMSYIDERTNSSVDIVEFITEHDEQIYEDWLEELEDSEAYPYTNDKNGLALYLVTQEEQTFRVWEQEITAVDLNTLENFVNINDQEAHREWTSGLFIPSDEMGLSEWVIMKDYGENIGLWVQILKCMMAGNTLEECIEIVLGGGNGGEPDSCQCELSIVPNHITSNYVSHSDTSDSKRKWWGEQFYGAHYAEGYAKKKSFSQGDLEQDNQTAYRIEMICMDGDNKCNGCQAHLDIYSLYGSKLQVHTDTWGFGGKSEVSVKDHAILDILGNGGNIKAFDKLIAINQTSEKKFKVDKVISFISSLVQIGTQVVSGTGSASSYAKLANESIKSFKGMIERTGKQGSHSDYMYVEYDSIGNSQDPYIVMQANQKYAVSLNTNGQITYDGKGSHKTSNSYYGSSASLGVAVSNFTCPANTSPPSAQGCWSHSNAYKSPYKNTTTLQDNLDWFLQSALTTSGVDTSSHIGCVTL